jgi:hypothetical protein
LDIQICRTAQYILYRKDQSVCKSSPEKGYL